MKKNIYWRSVIRRENFLKKFFLHLFQATSVYPRLLLEVFIRKNFGERYFKLSSACTAFVFFGLLPVVFYNPFFNSEAKLSTFLFLYLTWYGFLVLFFYFAIQRHLEIKKNPSVFDFTKLSTYSGDIHPQFFKVQLPGRKTDARLIETILEPAPFLGTGLLFWAFGQSVGILLVVCSIIYSLGYMSAYNVGDDFIMDKIDEMICNEELERIFLEDTDDEETRNVEWRGRKPASMDLRRKLLPLMMEEADEAIEAR